MGLILGMIIGGCLFTLIYSCLCVASDADDRAENNRKSKEDK